MNKVIYIIILSLMAKIHSGFFQKEDIQAYAIRLEDYKRIATESYNAVFFSTFPIEYYAEEDYAYYNDIPQLKTSFCIPDVESLNAYLSRAFNSGNEVDMVYLGIQPDIIRADRFLNTIEAWEDKRFEVVLAYPSLEYWRELDEEEFHVVMDAYTDFVNLVMLCYEDNMWLQDHLALYFFNTEEWLVGNYTNYEGNFNINEGIAHTLSKYLYQNRRYQLTLENYAEVLEDFEALVNNYRAKGESAYPDLSDWDVVFFGDSVIAFTETSSIPGAFGVLTGAHTYNCGRGGSIAAEMEGAYPGISAVVDAFLTEDLSLFSEDTLTYLGITDYYEHADKNRQQCFVINFGLNDYFNGSPVSNADPHDIHTYAGALRTAIEKLQDAYPDAVIMLMSPNFTTYFESGQRIMSDAGGQLTDYVSAVISICDEKNLLLYDSYHLLGIDDSNYTEYLLDSCHPNEATRYMMAQGLAELIDTMGALYEK